MKKITNLTPAERFQQTLRETFSQYYKNELSLSIKKGILAKKRKLPCKSK